MAQHVSVFDSGLAYTRQASADVTGGQVVEVTGSGTAGPAGATSTAWLGTAAFDAATGEDFTVHIGGVQRAKAAGAIDAGDIVVTAASGAAASSTTPGAGQQVGVAITSAADGETVELQMAR